MAIRDMRTDSRPQLVADLRATDDARGQEACDDRHLAGG